MKRNKRAAGLLAVLLFAHPAGATTTNFTTRSGGPAEKPLVVAEPRKEFPSGEKMAFDVSWMGIPVGVGTLEITRIKTTEGRDAYHVVAVAKTNEVLSKLYPVEDRVTSTFDAADFRSLVFRKTLSEGGYRADEETTFDAPPGKARYKSLRNGSEKEFDAVPGSLDIVSAFYAFRMRPAKPGSSEHFKVSSEEKDYDVEIAVLKTERKEMFGRVIDTIMTEPKTRLKGVLYRRGRVWIHFTADERRIPLLIQFKTPFGPIIGVLRDFDSV